MAPIVRKRSPMMMGHSGIDAIQLPWIGQSLLSGGGKNRDGKKQITITEPVDCRGNFHFVHFEALGVQSVRGFVDGIETSYLIHQQMQQMRNRQRVGRIVALNNVAKE